MGTSFYFNGIEMDIVNYTIELYLGNALIQQEQQQMPIPFAIQQCNQLVNQIAMDNRPLRVIIKTPYITEQGKTLINSVDFANNTYTKEFNLDKEGEN